MSRPTTLVSLFLKGNALQASITVYPGAAFGPHRWVGSVHTDRPLKPVYAWTYRGAKYKARKLAKEHIK